MIGQDQCKGLFVRINGFITKAYAGGVAENEMTNLEELAPGTRPRQLQGFCGHPTNNVRIHFPALYTP
jgi:hypothetical protein